MKNIETLDKIINRSDTAVEQISEFEDMPVETTQNEAQRETKNLKQWTETWWATG